MIIRMAMAVLAMLLTSCSYNYQLGIPEGASKAELSTVVFNNRFKVLEIDGKKFVRKPSIWVDGSHTVELLPGFHKFTLKYSDVNLNSGGMYTVENSTVSSTLAAGVKYEIRADIKVGRVYFSVAAVEQPNIN